MKEERAAETVALSLLVMKEIFRVDGLYYRLMTLAANAFIINLVFVLSGLTVVLLGPAIIALYQITKRVMAGEEDHVLTTYFKIMKKNLVRGWQLFGILLVGAGLAIGLTLLVGALGQWAAAVMIFFVASVALLLGTFAYDFALSQDSVRQAFNNALILFFQHIVYSIVILLIPVVVLSLIGKVNLYLALCLGFFVACYLQIYFVRKVGVFDE
ncbi:DUF624 domain-containing protein [Lacticaseibacillus yichunensis]|uniref:DUF624 domain-containing protein n=3 Tax=Bacilli TaxID=91061 RepID=A0ABW4CQS1_9LACO